MQDHIIILNETVVLQTTMNIVCSIFLRDETRLTHACQHEYHADDTYSMHTLYGVRYLSVKSAAYHTGKKSVFTTIVI